MKRILVLGLIMSMFAGIVPGCNYAMISESSASSEKSKEYSSIDYSFPIQTVSGINNWHLSADDTYIYPITPDKTPEKWKSFDSHVEKLNACQIPSHLLSLISTAGLVETCANYPLSLDLVFYPDLASGMKFIEDNYNGLPELYQRPDAPSECVNFFMSINVKSANAFLDKPKSSYEYTIAFIELFISNRNTIDRLTNSEKLNLANAVLRNLSIQDDGAQTNYLLIVPAALILGRILYEGSTTFRDYARNDADIDRFISDGSTGDLPTRLFVENAYQIIEKAKFTLVDLEIGK